MFKFIVLFYILLNDVNGAAAIVGGTDAAISDFPSIVSVQRSGQHFCGGSIFANNVIITAAHCGIGVNKTLLKIRAGSAKWNSGGDLISVRNFITHENYKPPSPANDIAVILLDTPLKFSSSIKSVTLSQTDVSDQKTATIAGWGSTGQVDGKYDIVDTLKSAFIKTLTYKSCASKYFNKTLTSDQFCDDVSSVDACLGDSGGPAFDSNGNLIGIVSEVIGCLNQNLPSVFENIYQFKSWIQNAAKK